MTLRKFYQTYIKKKISIYIGICTKIVYTHLLKSLWPIPGVMRVKELNLLPPRVDSFPYNLELGPGLSVYLPLKILIHPLMNPWTQTQRMSLNGNPLTGQLPNPQKKLPHLIQTLARP